MVLAAPVLIAALGMALLDRTAQTSFYIPSAGGSGYLYQNLFWVFGHPEVYILALPGFAIVLEILPVFARKPLWGYRLAVAGLLGVSLLSFFVWQHHLFVSGINGDLRPFYMLSTELISIPTGFTFICGMMTLWRGQIRYTVPMLFCLAWFFNFLIGGLSGVFLSDVPSDVTTHGTFFSMAHFHYTIVGGLVFTFFAAIYYWVPKMTGFQLNERMGKIHFWWMFIAFNSTFAPLFAAGFLGMPRRVVTYPASLQFINVWVSVSAFFLGASMLFFIGNLVYSLVFARVPAGDNPWQSKSIEWQLPSPVPVYNFTRSRSSRAIRTATANRRGRSPFRQARRQEGTDVSDFAHPATEYEVVESEPPEVLGRNLVTAGHLLASASAFFFLAFVFAYFYLRSLNNHGMWRPKGVNPSVGWGTVILACVVLERAPDAARPDRPPRGAKAAVAREGARRARARSARARPADRRVGEPRLRPGGRRLRERLRRLDGVLLPLRVRHDVLARDGAGDILAVSRLGERGGHRRAGRGVGRSGTRGRGHPRSGVARAGRARRAQLLLDVPRGDRGPHVDRSLPRVGRVR